MVLEGYEFRAVIYNAARDNNLPRLKIFLEESRSEDWIYGCLNSTTINDKVPLVVASRYGFLSVVQYLISKGAQAGVPGTVTFDGETINNAPSLWAAAAAGHLEVVKYLVLNAGAEINQATSTDSTPLRGACYDGHMEIVKFLVENGADMEITNRHGHTPLMIACFRGHVEVAEYLISKGADITKKSLKGNTALHDAAEGDRALVCDLLVKAGAKLEEDDTGACPLMSSAMLGHESTIPILMKICESGLKKRDALKVLGCTRCDKKSDLAGTLEAWKEAVSLPLTVEEKHMVSEQTKNFTVPEVYGNIVEIQNRQQVDALAGHPDDIYMMSLLIRQRVLGDHHPEVHYHIRYRGAVYCDLHRVDRCFDLWMHSLNLQQTHLAPLHFSTVATFQAFQETFSLAINDHRIHFDIGRANSVIKTEHVTMLYERICDELQRLLDWGDKPIIHECGESHHHCIQDEKERIVLIALQFILLVDRLALDEPYRRDEEDDDKLDRCSSAEFNAGRLVRLCRKLNLKPLHLALHDVDRAESSQFPAMFVLKKLLECGADLNETDFMGNTPLHILLFNPKPRRTMVNLLLEKGAELLARNGHNQTCLDIFDPVIFSAVRPGRYLTLAGLAANIVNSRFGACVLDILPPSLHSFYAIH